MDRSQCGCRCGWPEVELDGLADLLGTWTGLAAASFSTCASTAGAARPDTRGDVVRNAPCNTSASSLADAAGFAPAHSDDRSESGESSCIICFAEQKTHAAVPCGHQCVCAGCSTRVQDACPICREPIAWWMRVHMV